MELVIVWYLRMSVIYFVVGALVGFGMLLWPAESGSFIELHVHLNLLGFMSMMIYGVGYHILPRFSGQHIYSPKIMTIQFWFANAGLIGMGISWPFVAGGDGGSWETVLIAAALLSLVSVILFAFNMMKTIKTA
ncbi:MAG: cbb3-type cytochrome c oxidase subunit I [Nitrospirota bacterium]